MNRWAGDDGIGMLAQLGHGILSLGMTPFFPTEWHGTERKNKGTSIAGDPSNLGSGPTPGASTESGEKEYHIDPVELFGKSVFFLLHRFAGDGKLSTCSHAASQCPPVGHLASGNGFGQGAGIDIDNEMLDPVKIIEAQTVDQEIPPRPLR